MDVSSAAGNSQFFEHAFADNEGSALSFVAALVRERSLWGMLPNPAFSRAMAAG
jgi:hypothetical protein